MSAPEQRAPLAVGPSPDEPSPPGRSSVYGYCRLRGVPQSYLRHHLEQGVLAPALDAHRRLDIALADRLLLRTTRPGSRLGAAVRKAVPADAVDQESVPVVSPRLKERRRHRPSRRWQEKPLPDPDSGLTEAQKEAMALLRRRGFEVVPQPDGRFRVEGMPLTAAEMIVKAKAMRTREASLRARQAAAMPLRLPATPSPSITMRSRPAPGAAPRAMPESNVLGYALGDAGERNIAEQAMRLKEAGALEVFIDEPGGRLMDRPGLTALLTRARRGDTLSVVALDRLGHSLPELLGAVAMLEERGIALVSLEERIDTSAATGASVFQVFDAIARFERRLLLRPKNSSAAPRGGDGGKRPGRKPLDPGKAAAALSLVAAGLSPAAAARRLGLGRSTVYREVSRAGAPHGA